MQIKFKYSPKFLFLGLVLLQLLIVLGILTVSRSGRGINIGVLNEPATSDQVLYEKLEEICEDNGGEKYDSCSMSPLCGTENDSKSNDERVDIYDSFFEENSGPDDSAQTCMGDGRGCSGRDVPLCCYAMAATGDPLKCQGYWERLWCPSSLCNKIDENKADACGGGKCQCGHAYGGYCGEDGDHPQGEVLSLCERLKLEGVTGIVCTANVNPTPTPSPTQPINPGTTPVPGPSGNTNPSCKSFNFVDQNNNIIAPEQRINDQQNISISLVGTELNASPSRLQICWAVAGQSTQYYQTSTNWACEDLPAGQMIDSVTKASTISTKSFDYFAQKLPGGNTDQVKNSGLMFIANVYSANFNSLYCSANPAYNNGTGVFVDMTKQDPAQRFTNSTCALGLVGIQSSQRCVLNLKYGVNGTNPTPTPTPGPGVSPTPINPAYDLDASGSINIADFVVFVRAYRAQDLRIDYNGDSRAGIEDFEYFRTEYMKAQMNRAVG